MNNSAVPYWLAFAAVLAALYGGYKWRQVAQSQLGGVVEMVDLPPLEEFELTTSDGKPFRSRDMEGKVWVVSFFFATCPGSCSRLNANIKHLGTLDETQGATWVSITVDPETDTLERLAQKAKDLGADPAKWLLCRADFDLVKRIAHDLLHIGGVGYKSHNDYAVVMRKDGSVAGMFNAISDSDSAKGVKLIKKCLDEEWSPPSATTEKVDSPVESALPQTAAEAA